MNAQIHSTWILIINSLYVGSFAAVYHAGVNGSLTWDGIVKDAIIAVGAGVPGLVASLLYTRAIKRAGAVGEAR